MKVAFVGLGTMGYPMAGHLQGQGFDTTVYNRSTNKAEQWVGQYGGKMAHTAKDACIGANMVMVCVGNDNDLRGICYGENGILSSLSTGTILIDHTTTSAQVAQEIAQACEKQGCHFLDAPVSGGQIGAENGQLTIMVGGDESIFHKAEPTLNVYAKSVTRLGPTGTGQICKMANQLCIAGILQGMTEGLGLAKEAGLDIVAVSNVLKHGAAQSWQLEQRTATIAQDKFDFGFAIDWMRKDLNICFEQANDLGIDLPMANLVDSAYAALQQQGHNRSDTSVLVKSIIPKG